MTQDNSRRLLSQRQTQDYCGGVSHMWISRRLEHDGFPRPIKIAGRNYFDKGEVDAWIERQREAA
jgi:predicted DNA-binding transcriptional regulator AlpA